ncbi:hypothetical protein Zmor_010055 [Zophobas morio]|uniref:UDP-glucuronosyltransferase n=1 Tax=Zophobas morio TaxID=2755281 RepID=A0AA38INL3_9CUCU|nr:hypothetical protein Zmor_010055 [Zophobas morio]
MSAPAEVLLFALLAVLTFFPLVYSFKILIVNPFPGKSHDLPFFKLTEGLVKKGHQVTAIGHFPLGTPLANCTYVRLAKPENVYVSFFDLKSFSGSRSEKWFVMNIVKDYAETLCAKDFASDSVRRFFNEIHNFDVMVTLAFSGDCFFSLAHKYKVPVVGITGMYIPVWISERLGNPSNPSYIPNVALENMNPMGFWMNIENLLVNVYQRLFYDYFVVSIGEKFAKKYFGEDLPSLRSMAFNISFLLVNTYFSYFTPRPLVPAIAEMGGIQTGKVQKPPNVRFVTLCLHFNYPVEFSLLYLIK